MVLVLVPVLALGVRGAASAAGDVAGERPALSGVAGRPKLTFLPSEGREAARGGEMAREAPTACRGAEAAAEAVVVVIVVAAAVVVVVVVVVVVSGGGGGGVAWRPGPPR